jgi:hypothetical protein
MRKAQDAHLASEMDLLGNKIKELEVKITA